MFGGVETAIARQTGRATVVVGASEGAAGALDVRHAAGLQMHVPADVTGQDVAVYVSDAFNGTFVPLNDSAGDPVTITIAALNAYDMPEAVYGCHFIKLVGEAAFTATILAKG